MNGFTRIAKNSLQGVKNFIKLDRLRFHALLLISLGALGKNIVTQITWDKQHKIEISKALWSGKGEIPEGTILEDVPEIQAVRANQGYSFLAKGGQGDNAYVSDSSIYAAPNMVTAGVPIPGLTHLKDLQTLFFRSPSYSDNRSIYGQVGEGECSVIATLINILYATGDSIPKELVAKGIGYKGHPAGTSNISAITDYLNIMTNECGRKAEYMVNQTVHQVKQIIDAGGMVELTEHSRSNCSHWVVVYGVETDENGENRYYVHDSGKFGANDDGKYMVTHEVSDADMRYKMVCGSIWKIPEKVLEQLMKYSFMGDVGGSVIRYFGMRTVGIALYPQDQKKISAHDREEMFYRNRHHNWRIKPGLESFEWLRESKERLALLNMILFCLGMEYVAFLLALGVPKYFEIVDKVSRNTFKLRFPLKK